MRNRHPQRALKKAEEFHIRAMTIDEILEDKEIEVILNLTIPEVHYEINKKSLLAGKHVYSEKPLASSLEEGKELLELAKQKHL